jgi:hypothetical protein
MDEFVDPAFLGPEQPMDPMGQMGGADMSMGQQPMGDQSGVAEDENAGAYDNEGDEETSPLRARATDDLAEQDIEGQMEKEAQATEDLAAQLEAMPDGERYAIAFKKRGELLRAVKADHQNFTDKLIQHLNQVMDKAELRREEVNRFDAMKSNAERRLKNVVINRLNADGTVDKSYKDGVAECNIPAGLSFQAIQTAGSYQCQLFLESVQRPYRLVGSGRKLENKNLGECLSNLSDWIGRKGGFKQTLRRGFFSNATYGSAAIRFEYVEPLIFRRDKDGAFREKRGDIEPTYTLWPLEDVLFTNPELPGVCDQEGVFWLTRGTTLRRLELNEATFDLKSETDELGQIVQFRKTAGKFSDLDFLREDEKSQQSFVGLNQGRGATSDASRAGAISNFPVFDLVEYQGALPMADWIADGTLTPPLLIAYGINVGIPIRPDMDRETLEEIGRRLNRISHWEVAYISWLDNPRTTGQGGNGRCIRFDPCYYPKPRNDAFLITYYKDPDKLLGRGIPEVGLAHEYAATLLLNAMIRLGNLTVNSPFLVNPRGLDKPHLTEIRRLISEPNAIILKKAGVPIEEIIKKVEQGVDPGIAQWIAYLKQEFEMITGVLAAAKGDNSGNSTGTLGEIQINDQKTRGRLDDIVIANASEIYRLFKTQLIEFWHLAGKQGFIEACRKASGFIASDLEELLGEVDDIEEIIDEFSWELPQTFGKDNSVVAAGMVQAFQLLGPEVHDPYQWALNYYEKIGEATPESFLRENFGVQTPEDEHEQILVGNYIKPNARDNPMEHDFKHQIQMQEWTQKLLGMGPDGADSKDGKKLIRAIGALTLHQRDSQILYQQIAAEQAAMMAQQAGPPGKGDKKPSDGPNVPANEQQQANSIAQQAAATPGPPERQGAMQ